MKLLIIGSGGREHAIGLALAKSPLVTGLYFAPGNPGTVGLGQNIEIPVMAFDQLAALVKQEAIDLTFVGPEVPLVAGIVDFFESQGLKIVGPNREAAQLEGSKAWSKGLMKRYGIPTANSGVFTDLDSALVYLHQKNTYPMVVKADGIAAGKGVVIAQSFTEAQEALQDCFINKVFSEAGSTVVIEDFLKGQEASILAFTDGHVILPMVAAQDHKQIFNDDKGPNTGGMGAYAPAPLVTPEIMQKTYDQVFLPLLNGFKTEGITYKGIVYAGLMIDKNDISVVEFNARFGDPETQVVLPLLETDLALILSAIADETLAKLTLQWRSESAVCVVIASGGYPGTFEKHKTISGLASFTHRADLQIIHAGTQRADSGEIVSDGGRVLGVVAMQPTLVEAITLAYEGVDQIYFDAMYYRTDIGQKALRG